MNSFMVGCEKAVSVSIRKTTQAAVAAVAILLCCLPAFSQISQGSIQGGVFDQTGGAIAGATVTVIDVARGISRPFTTGGAGQYLAVNLTPGTYTVRAEAKGFQTEEHANVLVEVGQNIRVDLTLQPGAQTQTVTVTSEVPAIDTTDATLGGTLSNQAINALPLNGRNFMKLLDLRPGAVREIGGTEGAGTGSNSSFNGLRVQDNLFLVEGIPQFSSFGQPLVNQANGGVGSVLSIDAIQEFNTMQNAKAEFGWKAGAVVDVGLKSGTNDLHGTAYAFGRDGAWDANNFFAGPNNLGFEQFGSAVGGRIIKNKIFWFASFEGVKYAVGNGGTPTMPIDVQLPTTVKNSSLSMVNACQAVNASGKTIAPLSALLAGLNTTTCVVSPATSTFENIFPTVNSAAQIQTPGTSNILNQGLTNTNSTNGGLVKFDYQINDHHHLTGSFYKSHQDSIASGNAIVSLGSGFPVWSLSDPNDVLLSYGSWTWSPNSNWVNEARFGYASLTVIGAGGDNMLQDSNPWPNGYGMNTGVTNPLYGGLPIIKISGFSGQLGVGTDSGDRGPEGNIGFTDHVSYLRGKHAFKFGYDFLWELFHGDTYKNASGTLSFGSLQNFLTGNIKGSSSILVGNPIQTAPTSNFAVFAQDDWRVTTKVTVNLGLRWEYYTSPTEQNNFIGNFYPNVNPATTPAFQQAGGPFAPLFHPSPFQFSPRTGFAWDVKGNGRTVVRAGASLMFEIVPTGDNIDSNPYGANFPTVGITAANPGGINTSGTAIGEHTTTQFALTSGPLPGWINNGPATPIFPVAGPTVFNNGNGNVTYNGITCVPTPPALPSCAGVAINPHMRAPRTAEYNIDVQRAITNSLTVDVAYVGNHLFDGLSRDNINQAPFGAGWNTPNASLPGGVSPATACVNSALASYTSCGFLGANAAAINSAISSNEIATATFPQFPYLYYITFQSNTAYSNYNALQISAQERTAHGLSFVAGYTYDSSKNFTTSGGWGGPFPQDSRNVALDYGKSGLDVVNRFTFSASYAIPGIKSPAQLLQGWSLNGIVVLQGGIPWYPQDMTSDLEGTGQFNDPNSPSSTFWNYSGPSTAFTSAPGVNIPCFGKLTGCTDYQGSVNGVGGTPPAACTTAATAPYAGNAQLTALALAALENLGCYMQGGGVLTPPAFGTAGNAGRGIFHAPPYYNTDFSVFKDWKYKERYTAEFRAEIFNLFNRPEFSTPKGLLDPEKGLGFGCSCSTADVGFGDPVLGAGGPRAIQLGLKLIF